MNIQSTKRLGSHSMVYMVSSLTSI